MDAADARWSTTEVSWSGLYGFTASKAVMTPEGVEHVPVHPLTIKHVSLAWEGGEDMDPNKQPDSDKFEDVRPDAQRGLAEDVEQDQQDPREDYESDGHGGYDQA